MKEIKINDCYEARHTVDATGARYIDYGPVDYAGPDIDAAINVAEERTRNGQCGYVINIYTNERLMPDGNLE
jgi:hypothetical protein